METVSVLAGRYRLVEQITESGYSAVWAARDERSDLPVAVRLLQRGADDPQRVAHFRAAARATARLEHPVLARVLDEGISHSWPFVVTEWVNGRPLSAWMGQQNPWGFLRAILLQVCEGLAHLHGRDLIHLDLRPENIMVVRDVDGPRVRLVDAGLARFDHAWSDRIHGENIALSSLGSVRYTPPELARAPQWQVGPWSDLYALGIIAWEALTGSLPTSESGGAGLLLRRWTDAPPTLPKPNGGRHHEKLRFLFEKMLAPRPEDRPRNAAQVRKTVERIEADFGWVAPREDRPARMEAFDATRARASGFPLLARCAAPHIERERPLAKCWSAVQAAVQGHGARLVLVEGPPGTGRSHLVDRVVDRARERGSALTWRVRFAHGSPPGAGLSGALDDLLHAQGTDAGGIAERTRALPLLLGVEPAGLNIVLPALLRPDATPFARPGNEPDPGAESGNIGSSHMLAGCFLEILRQATQAEAMVLCLDDLHLASTPEGVDLVRRVLEADLPLCVVATLDSTHPETPLIRGRFEDDPAVVRVELGGHTEAQAADYLERRAGVDREQAAALVSWAGLHPLTLRLLADHIIREGEPPVPDATEGITAEALVESAFDGLVRAEPDAENADLIPDVLRGLALGVLPLTPHVLAALEEIDPHRPWQATLAAAERVGLITSAGGTYTFPQARVRRWLVAGLGERAESWHRRWLKALVHLEDAGRGRLGLERAEHATALGDHHAALMALLEAATWALGPGQQALERGLLALWQAERCLERIGNRRLAGRKHRLEAELLRQAGRARSAAEALEKAEHAFRDLGDPVEVGWCVLQRGWLHVDAGRYAAAVGRFNHARRLFTGVDDAGGALWSRIGIGTAAARAGHSTWARSLGKQAEAGFADLGGKRGVLASRMLRAATADLMGEPETAEKRYLMLQGLADERRWLLEAVTLRLHRARIALGRGRAHDALERLEEAARICSYTRLNRLAEWIGAVRPAALLASGDTEGAMAAFEGREVPNPRLCRTAAAAVRAALRQPTSDLAPDAKKRLKRWAKQLDETAGVR